MADSYNKKEREKKKKKRKQDKAERKLQRKLEGTNTSEFMYVDEDGNLTTEPPDLSKKKEVKLEEIAISTPKQEDIPEEKVKLGVVQFFNHEKNFGFIREVSSGFEYFVHAEHITGEIHERDHVEFEIGMGHKGPMAVEVKLTENKPG